MLYKHQEKFEKENPNSKLVCWETGLGKTVGACLWLRKGRDSDALVICPKRVVEKWKDALKTWQTKALVVSMEQFKKMSPRRYSALVVDEADEFASPLFTRQRSQRSEALYNQVRTYEAPILLLTATPIRSSPWNLHSLLCFIGVYIDYKKWRDVFFTLERRPYLSRPAYMPRPDWRQKIRKVLEKHADIVLLRDCVDDLPPVEHKIVTVPSEIFKGTKEVEPKKAFVEEHVHEQKNKGEQIIRIAKGYRKVLVVAYYREQIEELSKQLSKDRATYTVYGGIKDQENILIGANLVDECFLLIQADLGAGFDADSFSCVIFASMSYSIRSYVQMKGRVRRISNLHPVIYYHLHGGQKDKMIYDQIMRGRDFVPSEYGYKN